MKDARERPTESNPQKVKVLMTEFVTHDVKRFIVEKPKDYSFIPGQANLVSLNNDQWDDELRPFTFTSLNEDEVLEFTVKTYPSHDGVTTRLHDLEPGDELVIRDPFGTIIYEEPGYFIAAGAGITPFIAIFRHLRNHGRIKDNFLIFSNKTRKDVILEKELKEFFNEHLILTLTQEKLSGYEHGRIDKDFLQKYLKDPNRTVYICGPSGFLKAMKSAVEELGFPEKKIVLEKFVWMDIQ
ncbi:MAG: flavodoxin reductase [Candidatus Lokiarchaeota archaeon]|nr:flavodoxin reductase [Candidatus Lokiarchaeota archaeon]